MSDMYEVQAGKLAAEKGHSDVVKQFGQQMVDAHTKTTRSYGIVKSKNIKVDLPANLDAKHQKLIDDKQRIRSGLRQNVCQATGRWPSGSRAPL